MNTVYFSGKLKKKHSAVDVQKTICAFAKKYDIVAQCDDETKTAVDFGIDSEGFCFSVENNIKQHIDSTGC